MNAKQFAECVRNPAIRTQLIQWIVDSFAGKEGSLCAVTLTFKPTIRYHQTERSKDVALFMKRLNARVYGKRFISGKARLKCIPVFENNLAEGVHVHMFLERPEYTDRLNKPFEEIVLSEWLGLDNAGVRKAQDIQDCYNVDGWAGYITKEFQRGDMLSKLDITNMHLGV